MTATDKIWAWDDGQGGIPCAGDWCNEKSECPEFAVEYTRTASIPAPGAEYKNLFNNCHIDLRGAGYFCAFRNDGQILGVYGDGDKILCDYGSMNFDGLHILSDDALASRDAALSARHTDTRVVTVAQLNEWDTALSAVVGNKVVDGEIIANLRDEIRAIIGGQANE